ncbi:MAG TPA: (2Fe-2S) ferredoxin domain-containing protein [Kofleriaceae bacterium]|nr:(2Fe-2S) ferredoxin domain-containing protein [Kofleriaceae bacterium]
MLVCRGPECGERRNSRTIHEAFRAGLAERGLADRVDLGWQSCFGRCTQGPNCLVQELLPPGSGPRFTLAAIPTRGSRAALYNGMTEADVLEVIDRHVAGGQIVTRLIKPPGRLLE